jgi:DNA-binding transcriptional ArsR family regulator
MATSSTLTVTQIGEALGISRATVARHLKSVNMSKPRHPRADLKTFRVTISLCSRLKKWRAVAWHGGKYHALKYHATKEEAQAAVEAFRATVGA